MKTRIVYFAAFLAMAFAASNAAGPSTKPTIKAIYQPTPGDGFRIYIIGNNKALVCEDKNVSIIHQPDAVEPLIIECKH